MSQYKRKKTDVEERVSTTTTTVIIIESVLEGLSNVRIFFNQFASGLMVCIYDYQFVLKANINYRVILHWITSPFVKLEMN